MQEASPTSSLNAPGTPSHRLNSDSSSGSSCELAHATGAGPAAVGAALVPGRSAEAAGSSPSGPPGLPTSAPDDSWARKMPATWRYVEAVRGYQRPGAPGAARGPDEPAPVAAATLQEREELKNLPEITYHYHLDYPATEACLNLRVICGAGASVTSCRVTVCHGMSTGCWRGRQCSAPVCSCCSVLGDPSRLGSLGQAVQLCSTVQLQCVLCSCAVQLCRCAKGPPCPKKQLRCAKRAGHKSLSGRQPNLFVVHYMWSCLPLQLALLLWLRSGA